MKKKIIITLLLLNIGSLIAENKPQVHDDFPTKLKIKLLNTNSDPGQLNLLIENKTYKFKLSSKAKNLNGDVFIESHYKNAYLQATIGQNSLFGQLHTNNKHYIINTTTSGIHAFDVSNKEWHINDCGVKHNETNLDLYKFQNHSKGDLDNVIDVYFLYSQSIVDRYPDDLLETRLNQYVNVANQSFANSNLNLTVRKVGQELKNYTLSENNVDLLDDMRTSLTGIPVQGIGNLDFLRNQYGVDIFIYIRPHDILTRGNCGVAYYPVYNQTNNSFDKTYGVQVMSDGVSSWSVCTDQLFIHELGHNLGAAHHNASPTNQFIAGGAGFAKLGVATTIMGSFGTGQPERFMEVDMFSNPDLLCAGISCGETGVFDNTNAINTVKNFVANYSPAISSLPIEIITTRSNKDSDSDGINDWQDFIPFNSQEQFDSDLDGIGDNTDIFPNDPSEQYDFDEDGIGDNADGDDDNDGFDDWNDFFPFDPNENSDSDLDGVADNSDAFPENLLEQYDYDQDNIGDNTDLDDDNDTYIDLNDQQDLLIINTGNNTILRVDASTGTSKGIEVVSTDGLLTFQSDLSYRKNDNQLLYSSSSSIKQIDLNNRDTKGTILPAYPTDDNSQALNTGFPTSLISLDNFKTVTFNINESFSMRRNGTKLQSFGSYYFYNDVTTIIDSVYDGENVYLLDTESQVHLANPFSLTEIISQLGSGTKPYAIATNDELPNLYISHELTNQISVINKNSGALNNLSIDISQLGYSSPTGLAVTKDNILLVAAKDQNSILKFDAQSGEFLGLLISNNGIDQPHKVILVPQLNDRFHNDADKVIRPNAGLWYNPSTSGRGFDIEVFNNSLSVIWYTFDENGLPTWYISSGELNGFEYSSVFHKTHLNPDQSFDLEEVGTITINFDNERKAQVSWQINQSSGSETLQWLTWSTQETLDELNYTGLWGRPDGPGWGVSVATIGPTSVAIPYIYDSAGEPRWLISNPTSTASQLNFDLNAVFSDTLCPSCSGVSEYTTQASGSMTMDLGVGKNWSSNINYPSPLNGEWILDNTDLRLFSNNPTRPR